MSIIDNLVEVKLPDEETFLVIKETLTRIGVAVTKTKTLIQSCLILHKRGKYYIVHFKEMFSVDGKITSITEDDFARRNSIIALLEDWELIRVVNPEQIKTPKANLSRIKIISHKEKKNWTLDTKYNIGKAKSNI